MTLREFVLRLRAWVNRERLARELDAEMRSHEELLASEGERLLDEAHFSSPIPK